MPLWSHQSRAVGKSLERWSILYLKSRGWRVSRYAPLEKERVIAGEAVKKQSGGIVQGGPFVGLRLDFRERSWGNDAVAIKLTGLMEAELHSTIELFSKKPVTQIVNVGCSDGYYALGLGVLIPSVPILAVDTDAAEISKVRTNAALNGMTERLQCFSSMEDASAVLKSTGFVVCDVEGAEDNLIDPSRFPSLLSSNLIVELHEFIAPGVGQRIKKRFEATHKIWELHSGGRNPNASPILSDLPDDIKWPAMSEGRPGPMSWLCMEVKAG